jgi:hypothetical protein
MKQRGGRGFSTNEEAGLYRSAGRSLRLNHVNLNGGAMGTRPSDAGAHKCGRAQRAPGGPVEIEGAINRPSTLSEHGICPLHDSARNVALRSARYMAGTCRVAEMVWQGGSTVLWLGPLCSALCTLPGWRSPGHPIGDFRGGRMGSAAHPISVACLTLPPLPLLRRCICQRRIRECLSVCP